MLRSCRSNSFSAAICATVKISKLNKLADLADFTCAYLICSADLGVGQSSLTAALDASVAV